MILRVALVPNIFLNNKIILTKSRITYPYSYHAIVDRWKLLDVMSLLDLIVKL
jgi:hypothetical protein